MAWVFSRNSKEYKDRVRKTRDKYYALYKSINAKYELGISDSELWDRAYKYARAEADSHFSVIGDLFNSENWWKSLLIIAMTILSIVLTCCGQVWSWKVWVGVVGSIVSGIAGLGITQANIDALNDKKYYTSIIQSAKISASSLKNAREVASEKITKLLIYSPYAIFPEGYLYKDENPGLESYRAGLEAPNCMKGINGEKEDNPLAKQLYNRAHTTLGGNEAFDMLQNPFPTENFNDNQKLTTEAMNASIKLHLEAVQKGIGELANNYFCFDDATALENHFNRNIESRVNPRIKRLNCYTFLQQNKYYQKGKRLPRFQCLDMIGKIKLELPAWQNTNFVVVGHKVKYDVAEWLLENKYLMLLFYNDKTEKHILATAHTCYYFNQNGEVKASTYALGEDMPAYLGGEADPKYKQYEVCPKDSRVILYRTQKPLATLPKEPSDREGQEWEDYLLSYWECFTLSVLHTIPKDKAKDIESIAKAQASKHKVDYSHVFFVPSEEDLLKITELESQTEASTPNQAEHAHSRKITEETSLLDLKEKNDLFQSYMLSEYIREDRKIREDMGEPPL